MKLLIIMRDNIARAIQKEWKSIALILFSLFCIYLALLAYLGIFNQMAEQRQLSSSFTSVCITPSDASAFDIEGAKEFFQNSPLGEMRNAFMVDLDVTPAGPNVVGWKGTDFTRWEALEAGMRFFTQEEVESTDRIAIMNVRSMDDRPYETAVRGHTYDIIEHGSLSTGVLLRKFPQRFVFHRDEYGISDQIIIPYRTFFADAYIPDAIVLDFKNAFTGSEEEAIGQLQRYFPKCEMFFVGSGTQTKAREAKFTQMLLVFAGMCILSGTNIFAFFNGWIHKNARRYRIYMLNGASKRHIYMMVLMEWSLITTSAVVLAWMTVHAIAPLISRWGLTPLPEPIHYPLIGCAGIAISFLTSFRTLFTVTSQYMWKAE